MKLSHKYQGMTLTDKYLTVHFATTIGGQVKRHGQVKIPISECTSEVIANAMDRATRRRLVQIWSDTPIDFPPWD